MIDVSVHALWVLVVQLLRGSLRWLPRGQPHLFLVDLQARGPEAARPGLLPYLRMRRTWLQLPLGGQHLLRPEGDHRMERITGGGQDRSGPEQRQDHHHQ